ncbi:MAG: radical SAM protein [Patescibacteria group bacterium]|jgi:sulfatase maturation enzyme AslB (radical SAM superfamily)
MTRKTRFVAVSVSVVCNLACAYCSLGENAGSGPVCQPDSQAIDRLFESIGCTPEKPIPILRVFGPEPLLNDSAIYAIDEWRNRGLIGQCVVSTNGTLTDIAVDLAKRDWILSVSCDGTQQIDRPFKDGSSSVECVRQTIRALVEIGAKFQARMTVRDWKCFEESVENIAKLGVPVIEYAPIMPLGKGLGITTVGDPALADAVQAKYLARNIAVYPSHAGRKYCSLAGGGGVYYVYDEIAGQWLESCCYSEVVPPSPEMRKLARRQGCIHFNTANAWHRSEEGHLPCR